MKFIDPEKKPFPFCPGCTHSMILDAVDAALQKIDADPKRTVLVSDIGCVGLADKYFNLHTFHGLHGRSFTYASGIKLADPKLNVFVLVGDGGCGIGGHHLINAARRNLGIKVICFNNFNFGMTGGEHSVTTPCEGITHSTPEGNIEKPVDLCKLVSSSNATFVARKFAFDKDLKDTIAEALAHEGFAFIDILELCSAYYMPLNKFKKSDLEALVKDNSMKMGLIVDKKQPEYAKMISERLPKDIKTPLTFKAYEKKFDHKLGAQSYGIILAGSAGQKVVSAASNLCRAGLISGLFASQKDDYPVTVQTGHSLSEIKFSSSPIHYPGIKKPNALIITSNDGLAVGNYLLDKLDEKDIVILTKDIKDVKTSAKIYYVENKKEYGLTKTQIMVAAIAALLKLTGIIPHEALKNILEDIRKEAIRSENISAYKAGIKMVDNFM